MARGTGAAAATAMGARRTASRKTTAALLVVLLAVASTAGTAGAGHGDYTHRNQWTLDPEYPGCSRYGDYSIAYFSCFPDLRSPSADSSWVYGRLLYANGGQAVSYQYQGAGATARIGRDGNDPYANPWQYADPMDQGWYGFQVYRSADETNPIASVKAGGSLNPWVFSNSYRGLGTPFGGSSYGHPLSPSAWRAQTVAASIKYGNATRIPDVIIPSPPDVTARCEAIPGAKGNVRCTAGPRYASSTQSLSYTWTWDDGSTSTGSTVTKALGEDGPFGVKVKADAGGGWTQEITVAGNSKLCNGSCLTIDVTADPSSARAGEPVTVTATVRNNSEFTVGDVEPEGEENGEPLTISDSDGLTVEGEVEEGAGNPWYPVELAPGEEMTWSWQVTFADPADRAYVSIPFKGTVEQDGAFADERETGGTGFTTLTVDGTISATVARAEPGVIPVVGELVPFTVTVTNNGSDDLSGVGVETVTEAPGSAGSIDFTADAEANPEPIPPLIGTLAAGDSAELTVTGVARTAGNATETFRVKGVTQGFTGVSASATVDVPVNNGPPDPIASVALDPATPAVGDTATVTATVENPSWSGRDLRVFTDGDTLQTVTSGGISNASTEAVDTTLAPGESAPITLSTWQVDGPGEYRFDAPVHAVYAGEAPSRTLPLALEVTVPEQNGEVDPGFSISAVPDMAAVGDTATVYAYVQNDVVGHDLRVVIDGTTTQAVDPAGVSNVAVEPVDSVVAAGDSAWIPISTWSVDAPGEYTFTGQVLVGDTGGGPLRPLVASTGMSAAADHPAPEISLTTDPESFAPGEPFTVRETVTNPGTEDLEVRFGDITSPQLSPGLAVDWWTTTDTFVAPGEQVTFDVGSFYATRPGSFGLRVPTVVKYASQAEGSAVNADLAVSVADPDPPVPKTAQTITFDDPLPGATIGDGDRAVMPTASSGLGVTVTSGSPSVCAVSGTGPFTVAILLSGTCALSGDQAGDGTFAPADQVTRTFTVVKKPQTIGLDPIADATMGDPPFTAAAVASSGLPVTFRSGQTYPYWQYPPPCTVGYFGAVTITQVGSCTVAADQAGDDTWAPAPTANATFTVGPQPSAQPQAITFDQPADLTWGVARTVRLAATASSGRPVQYRAAPNQYSCGVGDTGAVYFYDARNSCTVIAYEQGDGVSWLAAPDVTRTIVMRKAPLTVIAPNYQKRIGDVVPWPGPYKLSGLVYGDGPGVLGGFQECTSPAITGGYPSSTVIGPEGTYPVTCSGFKADNYDISYADGTLVVSSGPSGAVDGYVRSNGGAYLEDACAYLYDTQGGTYLGRAFCTGDDGRFGFIGLTPGSYWVAVSDPSGRYASGGATAVVSDGGNVAVDVRLTARAFLTGIVRGGGAPVAGVCAYLYDSGLGNPLGRSACTGADGTYQVELTGLAGGSYAVRTYDPQGRWKGASAYFYYYGGANNTSVDVGVNPAAAIAGVVTDATTGAPVAEACVYAYAADDSTAGGTCTRADGRYALGGLAPGDYRVGITDPAGSHVTWWSGGAGDLAGATPVKVTSSGVVVLNAALLQPSAVTLRAVDLGGAPVSGACAYLYTTGGSPAGYGGCARSDGIITVLVPTGSYKVGVADPTGLHVTTWSGGAESIGGAALVDMTGGVTDIGEIAMRGFGAIAGMVTGPEGPIEGVTIYLDKADGSYAGLYGFTGANGTYMITNVPEGGYRVAFYLPGSPTPFAWYGGTPDEASSTLVTVTRGGTRSRVDADSGPPAP